MQKERINLKIHPNRILIKITADQLGDMFSIWIRRDDGKKVQLFTDVEAQEGFEKRFQQNVSVGTIVAVGSNVKGMLKGDIAIIDYLVTGDDSCLIGFQNGHKMVAIIAKTTYHTKSSPPYQDGRRAWVVGDFDTLSPLLGYIRMGKITACNPYVFLKHESASKMKVSESGEIQEAITEILCVREVIAAHPDSGYKDGDKVILKETDLFSRVVDDKEISVIYEKDILAIK